MQKLKFIILMFTLSYALPVHAQFSLIFDGLNDKGQVTSYPILSNPNAITVEAWIYANTWKTPVYKGSVVSTGNNSGSDNGFDLRAGEGGKAEFNLSINGTWAAATTGPIMQLNNWYHLAGVFTGDSIIVYINGIMQAATPITGTITSTLHALRVGESAGWAGRNFDGKIDEVRIWNVAHDKTEIISNICSALTGTEPGLTDYWKLDDGTGTLALNSVATGTALTLIGGPVWSSGSYVCTLNNPDVGVSLISSPVSNFNLTANEQVQVKIVNYSLSPAINFPVTFKLGNNAPVTENVSASIPGFGTYTHTFTPTVDLSAFGSYYFKAYTGLTGDALTSNDTLLKTVNNYAIGSNFAVDFDGVDDEIVIPNTPALNPTTALTVEAWINASAWQNSISSGSIIAKEQGSPDRGYVLRCGNGGRIGFQISDNGSWKNIESAQILSLNRWYHVAGVFDGSEIKLYVNGELIASTAATVILPSTVDVMLGENPSYNGRNFIGKIDEVRIWNTGRTTNEINTNMTAGLTGTEPGLVAYYKLNDGLGIGTATDLTSNANPGTLNNFANLSSAWVTGYSPVNDDAGISGFVAPNNLTAFDTVTRVKIQVKNYGFNTISNIPVSYSVNGGNWINEIITNSILPNEISTFSFNTVEDLTSLTTASISIKTNFGGDADLRNDTATFQLNKPSVAEPNTIVAFNGVQHNFGNEGQAHYAQVIFPETPEKYNQIIMHISVACPSTGCDPWDQAGKISLFKNGQEFELGRFITPYGKACGPWDIDVTDFKSLLIGKVNLQSFVQVWGPSGWLVTVKFEYIKGTSAYPYYKISPLWNNDYQVYGDPNISYDLPALTVPIDLKSQNVRLRTTITGHGQANTNNAAEFSNQTHHVFVNGSSQFNHNLWKANCSSNTCSNQAGSWQYARAGWCPGQGVDFYTDNLTSLTTPGQNSTVDYVLQTYTNLLNTGYNGSTHTEPYYRIHSYLVESSNDPVNFTDILDVASTQITSPVFAQQLTAAETVTGVIKNNGTLPIINPRVSYFLNGNKLATDTLSQTLQPGDSVIHTFSQTANLAVQSYYVIHILVTSDGDQNATDDIATLIINQVAGVNELNKNIGLEVKPNPSNGRFTFSLKGVEGKLTVRVIDLQGRKVYEETALGVNGKYENTIQLPGDKTGMYFLQVMSKGGMRVEKLGVE